MIPTWSALLAYLSAGDALFALAVVLLGYAVMGVTGFGSALVIIPLLSWRWPLPTVVPLVLLLDLPASLLVSYLNRRDVEWSELRPLIPGLLVGALLGSWLVALTAQPWALAVLGLYIMAVAWRGLTACSSSALATRRWAPAAGVAAGLVEFLFGTAGPVVVTWLSRRLRGVHTLRATTSMALALVSALVLLTMAWHGQLAQPLVWAAWPPLLLVAYAGVHLGHALARRVSTGGAAHIIWCLLLVSAGAMVWRAAAA